MAWIKYKESHDKVPQSWIEDCQKMYTITIKKLESGIVSGKKMFIGGENLEIHFLEEVLSSLIFVIEMMPLTYMFRKCIEGYKFTKSQEKIYN